MNSNEGQPAGTDTQENYEATVLDFLDKEMATVQEAQKKNQQSDELDALVTDLLKQVITETGQPQVEDKPLFDNDELFSGLTSSQKQAFNGASPGQAPTGNQPTDSLHRPSATPPVAEQVETDTIITRTPKSAGKIQTSTPNPAVVFTTSGTLQKKFPILAAAAAAILIIGAAAYFFKGSASKVPNVQGSQTAVSQPVQAGPQTAPMSVPAATDKAVHPGTGKAVAPSTAKPSQAAPVQKQPGAVASAPAKSNTVQAAPASQQAKAAVATAKPEPVPVTAKGPGEEKTIVAQPVPVNPIPTQISATIEKPPAPPVPERTAPVAPATPEVKPTPPPQAANVSAASTPAPPPAPPVPASNNLVAAVPIAQASPVYPEVALRTRTTGSVILELQIDDQGKVVKATPVSGPAMFYNAAVTAAMKWRYKPASIGGINISSQSRVTMAFNMKR